MSSRLEPRYQDWRTGLSAIQAEQARQMRELQQQQQQHTTKLAKLVNQIASNDVYYEDLSTKQKAELDKWADSLPRPEGARDFRTFFKGTYGYGRNIPERNKSSSSRRTSTGGSGFAFLSLFSKKNTKLAQGKSSGRKSKRTQKRC